MAGHPIRNQQSAYLTEHEVEVFEARANGDSWRKVARDFHTSAHVLSYWIKETPERRAAWYALDEVAAESQAGKAEEELDEASIKASCGILSPETVRLALAKSALAQWHAGILNRARFGPPSAAAANVTVNLGGLHLTAVQELQKNPPPPPAGLLESAAPADYEILPADAAEPSLEELLYGR